MGDVYSGPESDRAYVQDRIRQADEWRDRYAHIALKLEGVEAERDELKRQAEASEQAARNTVASMAVEMHDANRLREALERIAHHFVGYRENLRRGAVDVSPETTLYTVGEIALAAIAKATGKEPSDV